MLRWAEAASRKCRGSGGIDYECFEKLQPGVAIIYAGGDDVLLFGEWSEVLDFVAELSKSVRETLKPITVSAGYVVGRVRSPVSHQYRTVLGLLEMAKGEWWRRGKVAAVVAEAVRRRETSGILVVYGGACQGG